MSSRYNWGVVMLKCLVILNIFCTASFALILDGSCYGQSSAPTAGIAAGNFASEPYVVRSFVSRTRMNVDGTGVREQTVSIQLQSEAALRLFGVAALSFAKASETAEFVYARARRPDGTVVETPVGDAQDQPDPATRDAPMYSDLMTKQLPLRGLHVGDTVEWQWLVRETKPDVPNEFWGGENFLKGAVVLAEEHSLSVPAGMRVTVWTSPIVRSSPVEVTADGVHTWTWQHTELNPTVGAIAEARRLAEEKRILTTEEALDATRGALPSVAWTTFANWEALGTWYRSLIQGQDAPDDAIRAKVAELTAGKATQVEKAQAIYAYVSSQIRYIAVSFGVGRLKPHSAAEVFRNQFGDCKDKHTLLAAMLSVVGVQTAPALVGVGVRFNAAVPSPASFNHLISQATVEGKPVWLDSTSEVAPWRALLFGVRDREALVVPVMSAAKVERTPVDLPYPAATTMTVKSVMDGKLTSESEMTYVFHDDTELGFRLALRNLPTSSYADAVQQMMANFGFAGITSNASIEHVNDLSQPLTIRFHYHREHDAGWGENRVTIPFGPELLPGFAESSPPTVPISLNGPRTIVSVVDMTLPAGWEAAVPDPVHQRSSFAEGEETYQLTVRQLHAEKKLVVLQRELPAADFKSYQTFYEKANVGSVPFLQLTAPENRVNTTQATLPGSTTTPAAQNPADLVVSAGDNIRANDLAEAARLLNAAKALNPEEKGLWMGYAAISAMQGKGSESEADLRQEIKYHPDEMKAFDYLVRQQDSDKHRSAAIETLRMWMAAAPTNKAVALTAVNYLEMWKEYAVAEEIAEAAVKRLRAAGQDVTALEQAQDRLRLEAAHK